MGPAAGRGRRVDRLIAALGALLLLAVHGVLEPAHLVLQHGGAEAQAHADLHAAAHGDEDHGHDPEHHGGDHRGAGHFLEVARIGASVASAPVGAAPAPSVRPMPEPVATAEDCRAAPAAARVAPAARGPSSLRAPPIG